MNLESSFESPKSQEKDPLIKQKIEAILEKQNPIELVQGFIDLFREVVLLKNAAAWIPYERQVEALASQIPERYRAAILVLVNIGGNGILRRLVESLDPVFSLSDVNYGRDQDIKELQELVFTPLSINCSDLH